MEQKVSENKMTSIATVAILVVVLVVLTEMQSTFGHPAKIRVSVFLSLCYDIDEILLLGQEEYVRGFH